MAYAAFQAMEFVLGGVNQRLHDARSRSSGAGQSASLGPQSLQYAAIRAGDEGITTTQLASIGGYDPDNPASVWGRGFGSFGSLDGDEEAPGYDRTTGAVVLGIDYQIDEQFLVGLVGAYVFSSIDFDDGDQGDIDSWQIGLFGSWDSGTWYVDGLVSYAFQGYETERHIDFGAFSEKADADYNGGAVQIYGEVGYQFEVGQQGLITPLLGLGWTSVWTETFTENGAGGASLRVDEARFDSLATTLGVRGSLALDGWEPSLFLGWRHEFLDDHGEADVAFAQVPGSEWTVIGSDIGSDAGLVGVGLVAEISAQLEAVVDYSGQFSGGGSNHTGSLGIRLKF
jgi:outer membrane autotransporter protein